MDLLACPECGHRFYLPRAGGVSHWCPSCGHGLDLALRDLASIPLDARWLGSNGLAADAPAPGTDRDRRRERRRAPGAGLIGGDTDEPRARPHH
jgi:hypothetical protein